jgi:hypothetical protein
MNKQIQILIDDELDLVSGGGIIQDFARMVASVFHKDSDARRPTTSPPAK